MSEVNCLVPNTLGKMVCDSVIQPLSILMFFFYFVHLYSPHFGILPSYKSLLNYMNIKFLGWEWVFLECSSFGDNYAERTEIIQTNEDSLTCKKASRPLLPQAIHIHELCKDWGKGEYIFWVLSYFSHCNAPSWRGHLFPSNFPPLKVHPSLSLRHHK